MTEMYAMLSRPGPVEASILAELSPGFRVRRYPTENVTLRTLEGGAGEGAPVVLLHGRGHAATMWFPLLPELGKSRRVIAVDLPGFGHASTAPFRSGGAEGAVRYFVDPVETLLLEQGIRDPIVIGHSLGGLVALEIALRGALTPSRLVLIGGMGLGPQMTHLTRAFFRAGPERVARSVGPKLFGRIAPYPDTELGRRLSALEYELYSVRGGRQAPTAAFNALFPPIGAAFNRFERLPSVRTPSLLVWGEKDQVFPLEVGEAAARVMPAAELLIEPLGHSPHLEAPERVLPRIVEFIGR